MIGPRYKYRFLLSPTMYRLCTEHDGARRVAILVGALDMASFPRLSLEIGTIIFWWLVAPTVFPTVWPRPRQMNGSSPPEVDCNVTILGIAALQSQVTNFRDDELFPLTVSSCFFVIKCRFTLLDSKLSAGYINRSRRSFNNSISFRLINVRDWFKINRCSLFA